jgi:hypothetical protein
MKLKFKKKRFIYNLLLGVFWTGIALDSILELEKIRWTKYIVLALGISYLAKFLYEMKYQYIIIKDGTLQRSGLFHFHRKINLKEVYAIKEIQGTYYLKTDKTVFKIDTDLIDTASLLQLHALLKDLNLPADKNPFI